MSDDVEPYLLDRKQAAAFIGVSGSTIRRWYESGWMPEAAIKMHAKKYWTRESLEPIRLRFQQKNKKKRF